MNEFGVNFLCAIILSTYFYLRYQFTICNVFTSKILFLIYVLIVVAMRHTLPLVPLAMFLDLAKNFLKTKFRSSPLIKQICVNYHSIKRQ